MAKAKVRVELTAAEIAEALIEAANKVAGQNGGGSILELFNEEGEQIHPKVGFVEFQFVKK